MHPEYAWYVARYPYLRLVRLYGRPWWRGWALARSVTLRTWLGLTTPVAYAVVTRRGLRRVRPL